MQFIFIILYDLTTTLLKCTVLTSIFPMKTPTLKKIASLFPRSLLNYLILSERLLSSKDKFGTKRQRAWTELELWIQPSHIWEIPTSSRLSKAPDLQCPLLQLTTSFHSLALAIAVMRPWAHGSHPWPSMRTTISALDVFSFWTSQARLIFQQSH